MIDVNKPLTVTLPAGMCNVVFQALNELPYRLAAPVIEELRRQILIAEPNAFDVPAQQPAVPLPGGPAPNPPRVNGVDIDARE